MRIIYFSLLALLFSACTKEHIKPDESKKGSSPSLSYMSVDEIPNEIIPLLYKDLIKDQLYDQAKELSNQYYSTLGKRKDSHTDLLKLPHNDLMIANGGFIAAANFPTHNVTSIGLVMNGNWEQIGGATEANLQAIGWSPRDFNQMNSNGAPDAFDNTVPPSSSNYLGTVNEQRRLEAFRLATIRFRATDVLGNTYYSSGIDFKYRGLVEGPGWAWKAEDSSSNLPGYAGSVGASRRLEALYIKGPRYGNINYTVTFNDAAPSTQARPYVYYRVHQQVYGWEAWTVEGDTAGVAGQSRRIEAMQVRAYLIKI